jgi:hypothetical protein
VAVISKDTAKLGFDVDRPCAAKRKLLRVDLDRGGKRIAYDVAACPSCGAILTSKCEDQENPLEYDEYLYAGAPLRCKGCGDKLATSARGFRKGVHLDRYIQRKMRGFFDAIIADEVHELAGADTIQGNCFGTRASACCCTLALTGTLRQAPPHIPDAAPMDPLTMNTYARVRPGRLNVVAEAIGEVLRRAHAACATGVLADKSMGELIAAKPRTGGASVLSKVVRPEGLEPPTSWFEATHSIQLS